VKSCELQTEVNMPITSAVLPPGVTTLNFKPAVAVSGPVAQNRIVGEKIYITPEAGQDALVLSPTFAPFYARSASMAFTFNVSHTNEFGVNRPLNENVDYVFVYKFVGASYSLSQDIAGGIYLINNKLNGFIIIDYYSLGGEWMYSKSPDDANNYVQAFDPFLASWEQYAGYQKRFPVVTQPWHLSDAVSFQDVVEKINTVSKTVSDKTIVEVNNISTIVSHITKYSDAHALDKANIGLGSVVNMPPCTDAQAADPTVSTAYITPAQLQLAFSSISSSSTDTVAGSMKINDGNQVNSDTDATAGLTAPGFYSMLSKRGTAFHRAIVRQQEKRTLTNYPYIDYGLDSATVKKVVWDSNTYSTLESLVAAIAAKCGVNVLQFDLDGNIFFPPMVDIPDLTTIPV
jgi:hypothetical protein